MYIQHNLLFTERSKLGCSLFSVIYFLTNINGQFISRSLICVTFPKRWHDFNYIFFVSLNWTYLMIVTFYVSSNTLSFRLSEKENLFIGVSYVETFAVILLDEKLALHPIMNSSLRLLLSLMERQRNSLISCSQYLWLFI